MPENIEIDIEDPKIREIKEYINELEMELSLEEGIKELAYMKMLQLKHESRRVKQSVGD